jgi:hypothetical protein
MPFTDWVSADLVRDIDGCRLSEYDVHSYLRGCDRADDHASVRFAQYCRWRRLTIGAVCAVLVGVIAWHVFDTVVADRGGQAGDAAAFGYIMDISGAVAYAAALCGSAVALRRHADWKSSRGWLLVSFVVPFATTFVPFMFPWGQVLRRSYTAAVADALPDALANIVDYVAELYISAIATALSFVALAPSGLSLIPAVIRGAFKARAIVEASAEMRCIIRVVPLLLAPLLLFASAIMIQATDSFLVLGAAACGIFALLAPCFMARGGIGRGVGALLALIFVILYVSVDDGANPLVKKTIKGITFPSVAQFALEFFVKYNVLTVIMTDYLLVMMTILYECGEVRSARGEIERGLAGLARRPHQAASTNIQFNSPLLAAYDDTYDTNL